MVSINNIHDLRRLKLTLSSGCRECGCVLSDDELTRLLSESGSVEEAAYRACVELAESTSMRLEGGTQTAEQRSYWLTRARMLRPARGRTLARADEVKK